MVVLGGVAVSRERGTPVQDDTQGGRRGGAHRLVLQGNLAHKKQPPFLGPP